MRDTFIKSLTDAAYVDEKIFLIVGDLGYGVVDQFSSQFPNRFLNVGISEQNMIGVAAGIAKSGFKVFVYSIANFPTMRCLEQIRNDVCYHNLDVTIVSIGAGFGYGTLGYSHFAIEDLTVMRSLPNLTVFSPGDPHELQTTVPVILKNSGPKYLRLGKNGEQNLLGEPSISPFHARTLKKGFDFALLSTGNIGAEVSEAISLFPEELRKRITHFSISSLTREALESAELSKYKKIMTVEEHILDGGFGSFVLEFFEINSMSPQVKRVGVERNKSIPIGNQGYIRESMSLDKFSLTNSALKFFQD